MTGVIMIMGLLILISMIIGFFTANLSKMIDFGLSYGNLFGSVKLGLARSVIKRTNQEDLSGALDGILNLRDPETIDEEISDLYSVLTIDSKLMKILDCVYCFGFWISLTFAVPLSVYLSSIGGYEYLILIILTPITNFFWTEAL